jgi:hypothetical protein
MANKDVVQGRSVDLRLFEHLLDSGEIFVSSNARSDGDDVLRRENFCRDAVVFDSIRVAHRFLGSFRGETPKIRAGLASPADAHPTWKPRL